MSKAEPKTSDRSSFLEDTPALRREIEYWSFLIGAAYMQEKRRPSEWEEIKLRICQECGDSGYPELAPIFIKEIEEEMACWAPPESTERRLDTGDKIVSPPHAARAALEALFEKLRMQRMTVLERADLRMSASILGSCCMGRSREAVGARNLMFPTQPPTTCLSFCRAFAATM